MSKPGGWIYALGTASEPWVKVGSTRRSVQQRMKVLQTGLPYRLQELASVAVETDVQQVEHLIHAFLAEDRERLAGEWFAGPMTLEDLTALVQRALTHLVAVVRLDTRSAALAETGQRLLLARRKCHLTQQELAEACGFPYQVISRVERGEQDLYAQRLAVIASTLGVSTDYLLGLKDSCNE